MNNDKIENLDTLISQVLSDSPDVSTEQFSQNRIKSPMELAQNELFSGMPQVVDLEQIKESMNADYAKAKKQKAIDDEILQAELEREEEIRLAEELAEQDRRALEAKVKAEEAAKIKSTNQAASQQVMDFTNVTTAIYNTEESESSRNYKKLLGKLIKKTEPTTEPFKVDVQTEGKIEEILDKNNEIKNPENIAEDTSIVAKSKIKNSDNISVRVYSSATAILDTNHYVFINKLIFASLATVFAICLLETGIMYFVINSLNPIHSVFYYVAALISLIPLGVGLFIYVLNPNLKVKKKITYSTLFYNSIIVTVLLLATMLVVVLLTSISLVDPTDYVPKIILPCLYIFNYPLGLVAFLVYEKSKIFNIK